MVEHARAVVLLLLASSLPAQATDGTPGLFKCRGAGNVPLYQDAPCPPGTELRDLAAEPPPNFSVVPFESPSAAPAPPPPRATRPPPPRPASPGPRTAGTRSGASKAAATEVARTPPDPAERRHLREGMSEGEVIARLGVPDIQSGRGSRRSRWTYLPVAGDAQTLTIVRFEDGKVVGVDRSVLR
jgi:hypothetical protein